jgi:RNA polymerase primary sigma factor
MENTDSPAADYTLISESLQLEISRALDILNERERDIIEMSFGIAQPEMTLEEIGDRFGLTRERVRQIREKAIRKLRNANKTGILRSYLG